MHRLKRLRLVGLFALVGALRSASTPCFGASCDPRPPGTVAVTLDLRGLIALVPEGESSDSYVKGHPMGESGRVAIIHAWLPRADNVRFLDGLDIPNGIDFGRKGQAHPLHFAALRIDAKYLVSEQLGTLLLPLPSRRYGKSFTYTVELEGGPVRKSDVCFVNMQYISEVVKGDPLRLESARPADITAQSNNSNLLASSTFENGEILTAYEDTMKTSWMQAYERCGVKNAGIECKVARLKEDQPYSHLGTSVTATRYVTRGTQVYLSVKAYEAGVASPPPVQVYRLPLLTKEDVIVRMENGPAPDLLEGGTVHQHQEFYHSKLFYLLAYNFPKTYDFYYFPAKPEADNRVDPFCTPLAQFVQPK